MALLGITKYLQEKGLDKFREEYASKVTYKKHPQYPNLILFKYKYSSGSLMKDEIVLECRGIILDSSQNFKPVAYPYKKFFNYYEKYSCINELDWNSALVTEKVDGTLCCLYFYDNQWQVSTTGQPDAGKISEEGRSFHTLFWSLWEKLSFKLPSNHHRHLCFMFELMTENNRIIVRLADAGHGEIIWLHGVRDMNSLLELSPFDIAREYNWEVVKVHSAPIDKQDPNNNKWNLEKVKAETSKLAPTSSEGYVVCDQYFNRIKVKSAAYIALSFLNLKNDEAINSKHLLQICKSTEESEFLSYYPEWSDLFSIIENRFNNFADKLQILFDTYLSNNNNIINNISQTNDGSNNIINNNYYNINEMEVHNKLSSVANKYEIICLQRYCQVNAKLEIPFSILEFLRDPIVTNNELFIWIFELDPLPASLLKKNSQISIDKKEKTKTKGQGGPLPSTSKPLSNSQFTITEPDFSNMKISASEKKKMVKDAEKLKKELNHIDKILNQLDIDSKAGKPPPSPSHLKPSKPNKSKNTKKKNKKKR